MEDTRKVDFLIVGQGLAGTLLSYFLRKEGQSVLVIDANHQSSSSAIAAGIINPITGYRFVKSWLLEDLLPFAKETYGDLADQFGQTFFQEREVLRILFSAGEENDWLARTAQEGWSKYVKDSEDWQEWEGVAFPGFSQGVLYGAQVDVGALIKVYQKELLSQKLLIDESMDFDKLQITEGQVQYGNLSAQNIVFCEGHQGQKNPWFSYLPFEVAKGEALVIKLDKTQAKRILKHKIILAPLGEDLYWVGSNYEHKPKDDLPSDRGRDFILKKLQQVLKIPFQEIDHLAAIRPATFDRRPFLGRHPQYPALAIFNGLGAKGSSLAPYFAKQLCDHLLSGKALHPEVDIANRQKK